MLFGPRTGTIIQIQPVAIHGTHMVDVTYQLDGEHQVRSTRLGMEALYGGAQVGERVIVHILMNVVTRIERDAT